MIFVETITINGRQYVKTYSDTYYVTRDGAEYAEAIDPVDSGRTYTESATPLEQRDATPEDYEAALREMGVKV